MEALPLKDYSRLCIHTITNKPWSIEEVIDNYSKNAIAGVTVWRNALENRNPQMVGKQIKDSGLSIVSLCRGGFFPSLSADGRKKAIKENLRVIDEACELDAPLIVLVCGSAVGQSLEESRKQIRKGIESILPYAERCKRKLAIEPLHPMYADNRSAINTIKQANDMCEAIDSPYIGVTVDVYHLWWDSDLEQEIKRCGKNGKIFAFHICDWKTPTEDLLNDRGLMGEGCIPIRKIRGWIESAGFSGFNEVEIFSNKRWAEDQKVFLNEIKRAYLEHS